jgi:hypothetical protein
MKLGSFFGGSDSEMARLTITSHKMSDCSDTVKEGDKELEFVAQVNPEKLEYSFGMTPISTEKELARCRGRRNRTFYDVPEFTKVNVTKSTSNKFDLPAFLLLQIKILYNKTF